MGGIGTNTHDRTDLKFPAQGRRPCPEQKCDEPETCMTSLAPLSISFNYAAALKLEMFRKPCILERLYQTVTHKYSGLEFVIKP